jgi:hypothetical protein
MTPDLEDLEDSDLEFGMSFSEDDDEEEEDRIPDLVDLMGLGDDDRF